MRVGGCAFRTRGYPLASEAGMRRVRILEDGRFVLYHVDGPCRDCASCPTYAGQSYCTICCGIVSRTVFWLGLCPDPLTPETSEGLSPGKLPDTRQWMHGQLCKHNPVADPLGVSISTRTGPLHPITNAVLITRVVIIAPMAGGKTCSKFPSLCHAKNRLSV